MITRFRHFETLLSRGMYLSLSVVSRRTVYDLIQKQYSHSKPISFLRHELDFIFTLFRTDVWLCINVASSQTLWFSTLLIFTPWQNLIYTQSHSFLAHCNIQLALCLSVFVCRCSSRRYTDSLTQQPSTCSRCTLLSSSIWCCKPQPSSSSTTLAPLSSRAWLLYSRSSHERINLTV